MAKGKEAQLRLQTVAKEVRQQFGQRGQEVNKVRLERQKLEAAAADLSTGGPVKPVKGKLAKTPIAAVPVERLGKDDAPPKAMQTPGPDPKIEPKPRKARGKAASPPEPRATKLRDTICTSTQGRAQGTAQTSTGDRTQRTIRRTAERWIEGCAERWIEGCAERWIEGCAERWRQKEATQRITDVWKNREGVES